MSDILGWIKDEAERAREHLLSLPESCQPFWFRMHIKEASDD